MPDTHFFISHLGELGTKLLEHINLSLSATFLAILIGVPLGILIHRKPGTRNSILGATSVLQTIPSLALLAFLIPFLGIGIKPTIVALTLYALLPITRNTFTGLQNIPEDNIEAAKGLGFTPWQRLRIIEIPLALPVIVAGIRTATAITIGITTIAAFIGAGGLGDFITQGLALNSTPLILLGAIPAALLALIIDFIIAQVENHLTKYQHNNKPIRKSTTIITAILIGLLITTFIYMLITHLSINKKNTITVASKNFTEQYILADMMADLIENKTKLHVIKKLNLGTTAVMQQAIENGKIDLYPEYTGTAYIVILKSKIIRNADETYQLVKREYQQRFHLTWLPPFGFSNSQTLAVRAGFAQYYHLRILSNLTPIAPRLVLAAPAEFLKRPDALPGLKQTYQLHFKKIIQMQPDLIYEAIKNKAVDVIEVFTTDGRINAYNLVPLKDNKHFYPPYYAAPVIRDAILKAHPEIVTALKPLFGLITTQTMRELNYEVNVKGKTPATVARNFLIQHKLLIK